MYLVDILFQVKKGIKLTKETKEKLKYVSDAFAEEGIFPIKVNLVIDDNNRLKMTQSDIEKKKKEIEIAIEYMMQNEFIEQIAKLNKEKYYEEYGIDYCSYANPSCIGDIVIKFEPCAWIEIIEGIMEGVFLDTFECNSKDKDFVCLKAEFLDKEAVFSFNAFIDKKYEKIINDDSYKLFFEISAHNMINYVLPRLFYGVGVLDYQKHSHETTENNKYLFLNNLLKYRFIINYEEKIQ